MFSFRLVLLFAVMFRSCESFNPIGNRLGIRALISSQAFISSAINEFMTEALDKPNLEHVVEKMNFLYIGAILVLSAGYYHNMANFEKWYTLQEFRDNYKRFQFGILVFMLVFMKNVENAI